jgi:hypothetical protein
MLNVVVHIVTTGLYRVEVQDSHPENILFEVIVLILLGVYIVDMMRVLS